jgi:integrase
MTGLRLGELQALRWMDIDFDRHVVRVRRSRGRHGFTSPKSTRAMRTAPLAPELLGPLAAHWSAAPYRGDEDLVFAHPLTGDVYDASRIRKRYKAALAVAGLRDARFHDLRHTFGTRMAAAGAPMRSIQAWMGHRDHATTLRYADHAPDPTHGARWASVAFAGDSTMTAPRATNTADATDRRRHSTQASA